MVPSWSKPQVSMPSGSISVKPSGPTISSIPFSLPYFSTASRRALETSRSSMKSIQPKRTDFLPHLLFAL